MPENPVACRRGFHFCTKAVDCFNHYSFDPDNKVAEVVALGDIDTDTNDSKCATNKIQIVREVPWAEMLELVNLGKGNSGLRNSGDYNSGDYNSGDYNSGDYNSGDYNSGYGNSGNRNSGNRNSGNRNSGNRNSGYGNSGYGNSGDYNSGDYNSGDYNKASNVAGCFNTKSHKILFFDHKTDMSFDEWRRSDASYLLSQVNYRPTEWVDEDDMTPEEKAEHTDYETTGGYLKRNDLSEAYAKWWDKLSDRQKQIIREIPNFDAEKFEEITGIKA
ncbi:hypothetical protein E4665_17100 [Sporolactobacillus shoreae]|uniref:DUF7666 domain-containing protein n=2 Tax=Sporolactobacillus shoreae TaxID=1465501 RepID=A0A4Z0GJE8_9BACL|nr:hypothetical protein E4665_17100 [Sporolactobacillus shoreae]